MGDRRAVIVLGMHRSGTSALTRMLNLLGVELGAELMPGADSNVAGHWEHSDIVQRHEALLAELGRRWDTVGAMPSGWQAGPPAVAARADLGALIRREFSAAPLWGFKDPRVCRLLPLWLPLLDSVDADATYVVILRHPDEVAASLERRDGMPAPVAQLLWLYHCLEAEAATRGCRRVFTTLDALLGDWRGVANKLSSTLDLSWPISVEAAADEIDSFLQPGLRHHSALGEATAGAEEPWSHQVYRWLADVGPQPSDEVIARLDQVAARLRRTEQGYPDVSGLANRITGLVDEVAEAGRREQNLRDQLDQWQLRAQEGEGSAAQLNSQLAAAQERAANSEQANAQLNAQTATAQQEAQVAADRVAQLDAEVAGLRERADRQQAGLDQMQAELDRLRGHPLVRVAAVSDRMLKLQRDAYKNLRVVWRYQRTRGTRSCVEQVAKRLRGEVTSRAVSAPVGRNPERIVAHIDSPADLALTVSATVALSGWACARDGMDAVEVLIDGVLLQQLGIGDDRPDVAAIYDDYPDAEHSGFSATLDVDALAPGPHDMVIVLRDRAGNTQVHARSLDIMAPADLYHQLFMAHRPRGDELESLRRASGCGDGLARFELWVDARGLGDLQATIESISAQLHDAWTCRIVGAEVPPGVFGGANDADAAAGGSGRFSSRTGFDLGEAPTAGGDQPLLFIHAGEVLAPDALLQFAAYFAASDEVAIVYADHDRVAASGLHQDPCFKPDWSPEHLLCRDYIGGVYAVRRRILGSQLPETLATGSPAWRYDLLLRLTEQTTRVGHIARVLWSQPLDSDAGRNPPNTEQAAVAAALARRDCRVEVSTLDVTTPGGSPIRRVRRLLKTTPKVSIVIPTTGRPDLVQPCVESLLANTGYPNFELVFLDNGRGKHPDGIAFLRDRGLRVIECNERFNWSRLNNIGAAASDGEVLLFLNDDIEIVDPDWLEELVGQVLEPDVGTVGSLLLYPDGRIQHAGVFLVDHGGGARHLLQFQHPEQDLYQAWHHTTREVSASTGACLMLRREVFDELGGFDEDFVIASGDISICLRAIGHGYRNLWTPHCRLIHHESVSRQAANIEVDEVRMWNLYGDRLRAGDPYYNPNLIQDRMDCGMDLQPLRNPPFTPPKRRAQHGLNLIGYIRAEMGVAEATRSLARAMDAVDFPFVVLNYEHGNPSRMGDNSWVHRIVDMPCFPVNILHVNADVTPDAVERLGGSVFEGRHTIGYWAWELPEFPDHWSESFAHVDEVWVPSEFVLEAVEAKSPVPVACVPHAVEKGSGPYLRRPWFELPERRYLFLVMYDTHSIQARKNPKGAIAAFRRAFAPGDASVGLVLKVNNSTAADRRELEQAIGDARNIFLMERTLSRYEVDSLMHCCDCLVSLHRSEGFGLPIAEAMALGRAVIATPWSGNADFTDEQTAACVRYELVEVGRNQGPYPAHQRWAEPDLDHAGWWMRQLAGNPVRGHQLGAAARAAIARKLGPAVVGKMIAQRIIALGKSK